MNNSDDWYKEPTSFYLTNISYPYLDFKGLSDELLDLLKSSGSISRVTQDTKKAVKLLSLNLYLRYYQYGTKGILNIYKKEKTFNKGNVYRDVFGLAFKSFNNVLAGFDGLGFINIHPGGVDYLKSNKGKPTRRPTKIIATDKFFHILDQHLDLDSVFVPVEALVELRIGDKRSKHYLAYNPLSRKNKQLTKQSRLKSFNELSLRTVITVGDYTFQNIDQQFKRVYRDNYETNGRLFCSALQNIPSSFRPYLTFNCEPTIEIDIISSFPLLAYALSGEDLTGMPPAYQLDGIECGKNGSDTAKANRRVLKQCLLNLFNTRSIYGCASALQNWMIDKQDEDNLALDVWVITEIAQNLPLFNRTEYDRTTSETYIYEVVAQSMYDKHEPYIKEWLSDKNSGVRLMYVESQILFDVIGHFTKKGIYCLPIHDSIRIAEPHSDELYKVMLSTIRKHLDIEFCDVSKVLEIEDVKILTPSIKSKINKRLLLS